MDVCPRNLVATDTRSGCRLHLVHGEGKLMLRRQIGVRQQIRWLTASAAV